MTRLRLTSPDCGACAHPQREHSRKTEGQAAWEAGSACAHEKCACDGYTRPAGTPLTENVIDLHGPPEDPTSDAAVVLAAIRRGRQRRDRMLRALRAGYDSLLKATCDGRPAPEGAIEALKLMADELAENDG